jgi:hypothetical protein
MSAVDRYVAELDAALHVRGAVRRRFLHECRDHLADAAAEHGQEHAVRAFGRPSEIAAAFDAEVAARRGVRSTFVSVAGVPRRLDGSAAVAVRPPLEDLGQLIRVPIPSVDIRRLLVVTTCVAAAGAFVRDRAEHATLSQALVTAGIEAVAVVACFLLLGRALGLYGSLRARLGATRGGSSGILG